MKSVFFSLALICSIGLYSQYGVAKPVQWVVSEAKLKITSGRTQTAFVISDKAARVVIDLFSSAADSVEDAANANSREEETGPPTSEGVEIENVEDLDIETGSTVREKSYRRLEANR